MQPLAAIGLLLSLVGASLDFTSGILILQSQSTGMMGSIEMMPTIGDASSWATVLFVLGILLIITGALGISQVGTSRMRLFGSLMVVYGVVMVGIGVFMSTMMVAAIQNAMILGALMVLVGLEMIVNGAVMYRRRMTDAPTKYWA